MIKIKEILDNKIELKFSNVLIKKEPGYLYLTKNYLIWVSNKIDNQPFENIEILKESFFKFIRSINNDESKILNIYIIELWYNLYAHRKRDDKSLVGLRFERKGDNNKNSEFIDINMTFNSNIDFNEFMKTMIEYHSKSLESIKTESKNKEIDNKYIDIQKSTGNTENENNKRIVIEKKNKETHIRTIYEELNQLLKYKPELEQIYKNLVLTGDMSLESFMKIHHQDILLSNSQEKGIDNSDYFLKKPPKVTITDKGGIDVTITADDLKSILEEIPSIKTKIKEYVPHRLTEEEFWNRIIQSPFFFDLLGKKNSLVNNNDTLSIGDIPKGEELLYELSNISFGRKNNENICINEILNNYVDSDINLFINENYKKQGYGTLIDNELNIVSDHCVNVNTGFFERFNCHGAKILELTTQSDYKFNRKNEIDLEYSQDYLNNEYSNNPNIQNFEINPKNFFSSSLSLPISGSNNNNDGVNSQYEIVFNYNSNKKQSNNTNIFNGQISKIIILHCTKQMQYEQINQLSLNNKTQVIKYKNKDTFYNSVLYKDQNNSVKIEENNNDNKPIWISQIQQEHMQAMELLKYFWNLSLSQKDNDERRKTIESLNKITNNIELFVHDNSNISASKISTFGQSSNLIRNICLPILDSIKSARNFHYKLEELINFLVEHKNFKPPSQ